MKRRRHSNDGASTAPKENHTVTSLRRIAHRISPPSSSPVTTPARGDDSVTTGAAMASRGPNEARTQGAGIAALFRRLRTQHRAVSAAVSVVAVGAGAFALATPALAATPAPAWHIRTIALPTRFSPADQTDKYVVLVTNTGAAASNPEAPVVVKEGLAPELAAKLIIGKDWTSGEELECSQELLQCEDHAPVPPDDTLAITVEVAATPETGSATSDVTVSGGGAETVEDLTETPIGPEPAPFAIEDFGFSPSGLDGAASLQAGGHPYEQTTSFELASVANEPSQTDNHRPAKNPRDLAVTLPDGFVGNPLAAPRCPVKALEEARFNQQFETVSPCPLGSRIGLVTLVDGRSDGAVGTLERSSLTTPLYNLQPEAGHPAELGFSYLRQYAIVLYADLVHTGAGYRLRVSVPGIPVVDLDGTVVTIFGNPGARNEEVGANGAFLTNPSRCSDEPLSAKLEVDSWEEPGDWLSKEEVSYPHVEGCDLLRFTPEFQLRPDTARSDSPTGPEVDLRLPNAASSASTLSSPPLRDATVTLPPGLTADPSLADGLQGCAATGPAGIDIPQGSAHPDEAGEGEAIGSDGLSHLAPGNCPPGSKLATATLETPLIDHPLHGAVYLGAPDCSPCSNQDAEEGKLLKLYIEIDDPATGVVVKLPGTVSADPQTGRLTATFKQNPQLPFEDLKLNFFDGPRAPLTTPPTCGHFTTTTDLVPWSAPQTADATPQSGFDLSEGANGSACVNSEAQEPNKPSFEAGTQTPIAGSYSPFVLKLSREPGSQRLEAIDTTLPAGLTAKLAGVGECSEAQIAAAANHSGTAEKASPSCPPSTEVGTVNVGAGAGAPFYVQGHAYLIGPYKSAPLSLAIITPAVAGPFDLGTVVVRTALYVNSETAQVHAVSDPIPTILAGIPLDVRSVALNMSRPNFTLNPTSCDPMAVTGNALSTLGQSAALSSPFQVGACNALAFKPKLALSLEGPTKRAKNPALKAVVTYPSKGAYANIASAQVTLPHSEFLDQAHIKTICTRVQFNAGAGNGSQCPPASVYGHARAVTPLLDQPLEGNVYLRSSSHNLPDLVAALNGQINIDLAGKVDTGRGGGIRNTFEVVPDAPVSKFTLEMKGGSKGLLVNSENICKKPQKATVHLTAQNGKIDNFNPLIANSCPKSRKHKKSHKGHKNKGSRK